MESRNLVSRRACALILCVWLLVAGPLVRAADWPMWRYDAARSGISPEKLPDKLSLRWTRAFPPLQPAFWQERQERVQFDAGYEPVVMGKTMFIASNRDDRVTALDTETGAEKWRFYADSPIRFAPACWEGKLYVGSDDGKLYCLSADDGHVLWSLRGAPSNRKVLGNGRLISMWPVRGGPVVAEGIVYFSAGIWPFEGIFVSAADARTGKLLWVNDSTGTMYLDHPHNAASMGGPSPQGYLMIQGDELVAPSGRAFPAFFDRRSGKLNSFDFGFAGHGSRPASWFVATDAQGRLCVDPEINNEIHDEGRQYIGQTAIRRKAGEGLQKEIRIGQHDYQIISGVAERIVAGGREYRFDMDLPGIKGKVHTMLAADGKLFVVLRNGEICCLAAQASVGAASAAVSPGAIKTAAEAAPTRAPGASTSTQILQSTGCTQGFALLYGIGDAGLLEDLAAQSQLHIIAIDPDAKKVSDFRRRLDDKGIYGPRVAVHIGSPLDFGLPPYLATLVICEDPPAAGFASQQKFAQDLFRVLRPYGGTACIRLPSDRHDDFAALCKRLNLPNAQCRRAGEFTLLTRSGALPGAADYVGKVNNDGLVAAPLGILWFSDTFQHHKLYWKGYLVPETGRGLPQVINVIGGVMRYTSTAAAVGVNPSPTTMPYREYLKFMDTRLTHVNTYTDVYTGRRMDEAEAIKNLPTNPHESARIANSLVEIRGDSWANRDPIGRKNPLTGIIEGREFRKSHGCDLYAIDYGNVLTLRSGTAAFYDRTLDSGLVNISGIRSGCRNSIVPADGVLCLPSWTGNCTCNYPLFTSLALVQMPEEYEQWAAWGPVAVEGPVQRLGINFGAPGDRMTRNGTLWLGHPGAGGPTPRVPIEVEGEKIEYFYRHSLWMQGGEGWPWVNASGVKGISSIKVQPIAKRSSPAGGNFSVRWSGILRPQFSETYTFYARSDAGTRLYIGEEVVFDSSTLKTIPAGGVSGTIALEAGKAYPIRMEYFRPKDGRPTKAAVEWQWSSPSTPKSAIPSERLTSADGTQGSLSGVYYSQYNLTGPGVLQKDSQLGFNWGSQLPQPLKDATRPVDLKERSFTLRLSFAEPEDLKPGQRIFSIKIQGKEAIKDLDIVKEAGAPSRGIVRQIKAVTIQDVLQLDFTPRSEKPALICGLEMIEEK